MTQSEVECLTDKCGCDQAREEKCSQNLPNEFVARNNPLPYEISHNIIFTSYQTIWLNYEILHNCHGIEAIFLQWAHCDVFEQEFWRYLFRPYLDHTPLLDK